jgi:hypothetical protein
LLGRQSLLESYELGRAFIRRHASSLGLVERSQELLVGLRHHALAGTNLLNGATDAPPAPCSSN